VLRFAGERAQHQRAELPPRDRHVGEIVTRLSGRAERFCTALAAVSRGNCRACVITEKGAPGGENVAWKLTPAIGHQRHLFEFGPDAW